MAKFTDHLYKCQMRHGVLDHSWSLRGPDGGLHFHYTEWLDKEQSLKYGRTAGLEIHRLRPAEYQQGDAAHHAPCWLLGAPCWHDGTSAYATDTLLPMVQAIHHDHPAIFALLEREYEDQFSD